jgi:predicted oxidoreductase
MVTDIAPAAGASVINMDRMWHYTEGLANWNQIWPDHGIRVIPGPSSLWLGANGKRMPPFLYPGCDTLAVLKHICNTGHGYSWFIANRAIVAREFALSGSEQNPDITGKSYLQLLQRFFTKYGTPAVQAFLKNGVDFVVEEDLEKLVKGMNRLAKESEGPSLDLENVKNEIEVRDRQMSNAFTKDAQVMLIRNARQYGADKRRIAEPRPVLDPKCGPLVAVRMNLLTRKSLGGLETDLDGRVLRATGKDQPRAETIEGLFAAGEAAGFGGGGVHGYSSLEGTFLGGCIFSGMKAGRAMAALLKGEAEGGRARL